MSVLVSTLKIDIADFRTLSPQVRFLLIFQLIILFVLSILVGVIFSPKFRSGVQMRSSVPLQTVPTQAPQHVSALTLVAEKTPMRVGESQVISVMYDGEAAEVVDSVITFDPGVFKVDKLKNGKLFDTVLQSKVENGRVSFSTALSLQKMKTHSDEKQAGVLYSFVVTALRKSEGSKLSIVKSESFVWSDKINILTDIHDTLIEIH